jgi:hypothetical protein
MISSRQKGHDITDELKGYGIESLRGIIANAESWQPEAAGDLPASSESVKPFPSHVFPLSIQQFIEQGAAAIQCPQEFIAVPLIVAAGSAVGATHCFRLKKGWVEYPGIYSAVVANPGTAKTPANQLALRPVQNQAKHLRCQYDGELALYEIDVTDWKPGGSTPKPEKPTMERVVISDATIEAIAAILDKNPRGVLLARDELSGWAQSMNQFRGGKGADRQIFLSLWSNTPIAVDHKSQDEPLLLERPVLGVSGTIQPDVVQSLLHDSQWDDGFLDRILFAYPDAKIPIGWSEAEVDDGIIQQVDEVFLALYSLDMEQEPTVVGMTEQAKVLWVQWYNQHQEALQEAPDNLRGAWSKMPSQCARLILISHMLRWATDPTAHKNMADRDSVSAGIALAEYFKSHVGRVHSVLRETAEDRRRRLVREWIQRRGNPGVRPRDLQRASVGGICKAEEAKEILADMVERGMGHFELLLEKGPGHERFFLRSHPTPDTCS